MRIHSDSSSQPVLGQGGTKSKAKSSPKGGETSVMITKSPSPETGGHRTVKALTKTQKIKIKQDMNAFEDVITHATYTFYTNPKWTGLLQSLNDWAAKHEGLDFKKSNTNTISTTFRNLTVNFYTSTKCITITNSHGSRDDMTQTATDFKLWLQNTMDYSHDIDEELTEILTGKADFQLTKTKHTQSISSEQMSRTQQKTKQPTSELLEQDLLIILDKLYMNNIQKKALVPDLTSVYSVRLEHVPRIWKEITNEIKDKGSFAGFQTWWQDYIKIYLTNQKSSAIKWFRENVPKMHHLIQTKMEKTMKKQAPDTTISSIPELEQTNTPNRSKSLSLGTKLANEMANEETIKELTKALDEAKKAHDNLAIKTEANTKTTSTYVLALTETWQSNAEAYDYSTIKEYRWIGFPNEKNNRGTGFWISHKIRNRVSPKSVENTNPNIGWIQFIDATQIYYIAVVYVPYGDKDKAPEIYKALMLNCIELQQTGTTIIMGDLNTRSVSTGDSEPTDKTNKQNVKALNKLIDQANLIVAKSQSLIDKKEHWTFRGPVGGLSTPDYIMYSKEIEDTIQDYSVNWKASCDSYHAMQIITIQLKKTQTQFFWKQETVQRTVWNDSNISVYEGYLPAYDMGSVNTLTQLNKAANDFIHAISKAKEKITKRSYKRKVPDSNRTCHTIRQKIHVLQQNKSELLTLAHRKGKRKYREDIWMNIHDVQKHTRTLPHHHRTRRYFRTYKARNQASNQILL